MWRLILMTKRKLVCAYATNCELLDELSEENEELKSENQYLTSLKWNQDCINEISIGMQQRQSLEISNNKLVKENEQLKQFIQELTTKGTGKIHLANGSIYKVDTILINIKGDVE